jgi:hypothetical protein
MISYLQYVLAVIGIGYFITQSSLMKSTREYITKLNERKKWWGTEKLDGVVNCIYCASFWIGLFVYYVSYGNLSIEMVLYAFSCMGSIYVINNIFNKN